MDNCGIYGIFLNKECIYIGQSINIKRKFSEHRRKLLQNIHYNVYLQRLYNNHNNLEFKILESNIEQSNLTDREMYWIERYNSKCNMQIPSDSTAFTISDDVRKRMSEATLSRMDDKLGQRKTYKKYHWQYL